MYKTVLLLGLFGVVGNVGAVQMTPQIQKLLDQKAAKVAELEKCDKNRKAFVIAGVSTLGLTAVGIGGNIALANKNKKLDAELTTKKSELNTKRQELSSLQSQQLQKQLAQTTTSTIIQQETDGVDADEIEADQEEFNNGIDGTGYCFKDIDRDDEYNDNCSRFDGMQPGDWGVLFPYGEVYGHAVCNGTDGLYGVASNDEQSETGGVKCWCKMTHPGVSRWVFRYSFSSVSDCAGYCAGSCGGNVRLYGGFRSGLFWSVQ